MSDEKQKSEGWSHAPMIVGWNNDGSLQTVDSWNVKPTLTDEEREAISVAYGMMNERAAKLQERPDTREAARPFIKWARALQGLFKRLGDGG